MEFRVNYLSLFLGKHSLDVQISVYVTKRTLLFLLRTSSNNLENALL